MIVRCMPMRTVSGSVPQCLTPHTACVHRSTRARTFTPCPLASARSRPSGKPSGRRRGRRRSRNRSPSRSARGSRGRSPWSPAGPPVWAAPSRSSSRGRAVNVAFCYVDMPGRDVSEQALLTETAIASWASASTPAAAMCATATAVERLHPRDAQSGSAGIHYLVNNAGIATTGRSGGSPMRRGARCSTPT